MPRLPRFNLLDVPQHIIQRGNNRQACFFSEEDYRYYLECLREAAAQHGCDIHAYVLMTNHVHLLATPTKDQAVTKMMQSLGRRYVQYVNHQYRRTGTLWEGRYRASLVQSERYVLTCYRYIELNPVRAQGMVDHPGDYPWSSYQANAYGRGDEWLIPHAEYRQLGVTVPERQFAYRGLFDMALDPSQLHEISQSANQGVVLGSERFRDEIEAALSVRARPGKRGRPIKKRSDD